MSKWLVPVNIIKKDGRISRVLHHFDQLLGKMIRGMPDHARFIDRISSHPLSRDDQTSDGDFYSCPRFVTHIDDVAINSLRSFYDQNLKPNSVIIDLGSSWISHLPSSKSFSKVIGIGMNQQELAQNKQLDEYHVHDLNQTPNATDETYPLAMITSESVDHVVCAVSIDYLIHPHTIFEDVLRVLKSKSGSTFVISFSNRCFPTKAIDAWLQVDDSGRIAIVSSYFQETGLKNSDTKWKKIDVHDISKSDSNEHSTSPNYSDPLFVLVGEKV